MDQVSLSVAPGDITRGPTITRYEVYPAKGVRVDKITALERDLARATRAERINILAPIPGKAAVGVEVPNQKSTPVGMRELLESEDWASAKAELPIALGRDVEGKPVVADLARMPHLLVAGATGSGKSVAINTIITSLVYRYPASELHFLMIDPKMVELSPYSRIPHLMHPVITDMKKAEAVLGWKAQRSLEGGLTETVASLRK